jgi:hypothetical protein
MILHVTEAEYRGEYRISVRFNDGSSGVVDLAGKLTGSMFEPLVDKRLFARLRVDPELGTVAWDNGADLAPEYLQQLAKAEPKEHAKGSTAPGKARDRRPATPPARGTRRMGLAPLPQHAKRIGPSRAGQCHGS